MTARTAATRKYPGLGGASARPDRKKFRQEEARERQAAHDAMSLVEKIEKLDRLLGKGLGATRERRRLAGLGKAPKRK